MSYRSYVVYRIDCDVEFCGDRITATSRPQLAEFRKEWGWVEVGDPNVRSCRHYCPCHDAPPRTEAVAQVEAFISDTAKRGASWSAEELVEHLALNGVLPNEYPSEHG